jgi:hypothetical protein
VSSHSQVTAVRTAVVLALTSLAGCIGVLVGPDPATTPSALFRVVWEDFDRHYALFEVKGVDWTAVRETYQPEADAARSMEAMLPIFGRMFAELRDPHVDLHVPVNRLVHSLAPARTYFNDITVIDKYLTRPRTTSALRLGLLAPGVGYVWISTFSGTTGAGEMDAALASLGDLSAIVLDVRNNGGGNSSNAEDVAGRFVDSERVFAYVRWRTGPSHAQMSDYIPLRVKPAGRRFDGTVIVLTNRRTVSAAEHFVLALRTQAGIEFIGDTTIGGFGNPLIRELPNGWVYRIPLWAEYDASKKSHEGIGLAPNEVIPLTAADSSAGRDIQLERARELASTAATRLAPRRAQSSH